jgi:hypothetical protein
MLSLPIRRRVRNPFRLMEHQIGQELSDSLRGSSCTDKLDMQDEYVATGIPRDGGSCWHLFALTPRLGQTNGDGLLDASYPRA